MTVTKKTFAAAGLATALALTGTAAAAADLEVVVSGLNSAEGDARIAVHKRISGVKFPGDGVVAATIRKAVKGEMRVVFAGTRARRLRRGGVPRCRRQRRAGPEHRRNAHRRVRLFQRRHRVHGTAQLRQGGGDRRFEGRARFRVVVPIAYPGS